MKITDSEKLGLEIRRRRRVLGYTRAYISEITGFSITFISDVEHGKETCEIGRTIKLANLLGLDFSIEVRS